MAKILIIDDEESIRFTLGKFLQRAGHTVFTSESCEEAMECINGEAVDLVFTDIMLKGKSGLSFLEEVRTRNDDCPVVMITGYPHLDSAAKALRLQAFDYIPKPITQEQLLAVTARALQRKTKTEQQEKYRSTIVNVFRSMGNAVIVVDNDLQIIEINDAAEKLCGLSRLDLSRGSVPAFRLCRGKCMELFKDATGGERIVEKKAVECMHSEKIGQVVSLSTFPLHDGQRSACGTVMVIKDEAPQITEAQTPPRKSLHNIVGQSARMQQLYNMIETLAGLQTTVLITGESGTGKELVAEALHYIGERAEKPFIKVNCAALSDELLGSELFGHVKGAFTGAIQDRVGRFQKADGGSIFLDEIGDISQSMQSRLLRVLQEMEFERVGDSNPVKVDVRVMAATNNDLCAKVEKGTFRKDLYYRLKVVELLLPPLRDRKDDIPLLVDHFIREFNTRFNKSILCVSDDVLELFMNHAWDGNIRELQHTLEYTFIQCRQAVINTTHLPGEFAIVSGSSTDSLEAIPDCEKVIEALKKAKWNKTVAAQFLGVSRSTFYRKIHECNIM